MLPFTKLVLAWQRFHINELKNNVNVDMVTFSVMRVLFSIFSSANGLWFSSFFSGFSVTAQAFISVLLN